MATLFATVQLEDAAAGLGYLRLREVIHGDLEGMRLSGSSVRPSRAGLTTFSTTAKRLDRHTVMYMDS